MISTVTILKLCPLSKLRLFIEWSNCIHERDHCFGLDHWSLPFVNESCCEYEQDEERTTDSKHHTGGSTSS